MKKRDMIKGYPNPTKKQVKIFQANHRIQADGIIGPITRLRIWREPGASRYTHLIDTPLRYEGDQYSKRWLYTFLYQNPEEIRRTTLPADAILTIWEFLTSQWKTGFAYLSTQDGITLGPRRLAAGSLQRVIRENRRFFGEHFTDREISRMLRERPHGSTRRELNGFIPDVNNGFPLNDEIIREKWIRVANDKRLWSIMAREGNTMIEEIMGQYPHWTDARLICLALRAANSARYGFTGGGPFPRLPDDDKKAYKILKRKYAKGSRTRRRRISRIENKVPAGTTWKRRENR